MAGRTMARGVLFAIAATCLPARSSPALANEPRDTQEPDAKAESPEAVMAERLFAEGRELAQRGEHVAACQRFEASRALKPTATGPLVNLALCAERALKLATAAALYREVASRSRSANPERAALAEQKLSGLEPRLSRLRLVASSPPPGLAIKLDGRGVDEATWNVAVPIDGGEHLVEASAQGKKSFSTTVRVLPERHEASLSVSLEDLPSASKTPALVVGGLGAISLAVGVGVGVSVAVECGGLFQERCEGANRYPTLGERERALRTEETKGWIANVAVGAGVLALAAGAYLYFSSRSPSRTALRASPTAMPHGGAVSVDGRF